MANGRQFDPVAAAATSALDAQQRQLRRIRTQVDAPELPAESQAFSTGRNAVQTVSQFSPANVAAKGELPGMPDQGSSGVNLPGMDNMDIQSTLQQFAPQNVLSNLPDPLGMMPDPQPGSGGGSNGGSNGGGSSASMRRGTGDANAPAPSRGSGSTR